MTDISDIKSDWQWFGHAAHFICGLDCRFHLATVVGDGKYMVSTVGEYLPDSNVRDILAEQRGKPLEGRGDARRADWLNKFGYEEIGHQRLYETMVFKTLDGSCQQEGCMCGAPTLDFTELDFDGYNTAGDAARGHLQLCQKWEDAS